MSKTSLPIHRRSVGHWMRLRSRLILLFLFSWAFVIFAWIRLPALGPNLPNVIGSALPQSAQALDLEQLETTSGQQLRLNGRLVEGPWQIRTGEIGIVDSALMQQFGFGLLNTNLPDRQPLDYYASSSAAPATVPAWLSDNRRYLDVTQLIDRLAWQVAVSGPILEINTPAAQIAAIRHGRQTWGDRLVLDVNQAAPWQVSETAGTITVTVDAELAPAIAEDTDFAPRPGTALKSLTVNRASQRTTLTIQVAAGVHPDTWALSGPHRLVIDLRPDALQERDITWAEGVRWQQRYVAVGAARFPVYSLTFKPSVDTPLLPIWTSPTSASGISPMLTLALQWNAAAAINGGFFNRNNQLPLGAVRYNERWISGPILNRGAVAWNDQGQYVMDRLALTEVVVANGQTLPILTVNSGYVQAGIGRYTRDWGPTYTPLIDNEVVVTVQGQQVTTQQPMGTAGEGAISIPSDGYILALRSYATAGRALQPGTPVIFSAQAQPSSFEAYPHTLGAGPLLIKQGQTVLDPVAEGFSTNFIQGAAPRSALGMTADGRWMLVSVQSRVGGRGPTLAEMAELMRRLGAIDALNLDGGSSTSLYLNGQLLNRSSRTAARINNGLGLFLQMPESETGIPRG
ncbi:MAG: phosphodiester glycosidase family protein [Cyanobacteria bacterium J06554_6]